MNRLIYGLCCLFAVGLLFYHTLPVHAAGEMEPEEGLLYAKSAVLLDGSSGRILYEKNGQEFLPNASTTKILTCILALEEGREEDLVTVSEYAASMPDVQLNIRAGEQYRLGDLLYSLMLESHNDAAVAIAEHIAGSCEDFSVMMNRKAAEIGCRNTFFLTPNGLDATQTMERNNVTETRSHGTTACDLALLMRYCIELSAGKDRFLEITRTAEYTFSNKIRRENGELADGDRSFTCRNHNTFLQMMEGALSGKTGFTNQAGYCYVGALKRQEKTYIVALLACGWPSNRNYKWQDTKKLMEYGLASYDYVPLEKVQPNWEKLRWITVDGARTEEIGARARLELERKQILSVPGVLLKPTETLTCTVKMEALTAPVEKGQKAGEIIYFLNGKEWKKEILVCRTGVLKPDYGWCLRKCYELIGI